MSVRENVYMNRAATGKGVLQPVWRGEELTDCRAVLQRLSVKPQEPEAVVATLSGGNQQKVVLARWMEANVRLLILEEPTIGVDVELAKLAAQGGELDRTPPVRPTAEPATDRAG